MSLNCAKNSIEVHQNIHVSNTRSIRVSENLGASIINYGYLSSERTLNSAWRSKLVQYSTFFFSAGADLFPSKLKRKLNSNNWISLLLNFVKLLLNYLTVSYMRAKSILEWSTRGFRLKNALKKTSSTMLHSACIYMH